MYLKSIEVQGFKSFANKMIFKFNKGITGIVGPNGSGKSNVADAVRWVLGEQSAKQLRSSKMEDVIFSGTETRKPLGFAYVAITLDNSDHKLPVDFHDVTVARRVYRSGESEYLLNGNTCRLKDIQEMFFDTGIGKEGYSIIGQGQIDKILSGKPEERRELFDEAAGIVKYKKRKQAAEKNLEAEKQNLARVNDILLELEKQVGPLKRQEETAKTYLKLRDELKRNDVNMYLQEYTRVREQLTELEKNASIVLADLDQTKQDFENTKAEYEVLEEEISAIDTQIEEKKGQINEGLLNKEKLDGEIKVLLEQINSGKQVLETNKERIQEFQKEIEDKEGEVKAFLKEKTAIDEEIKDLKQEQTQADVLLEGKNANVNQIRETIEARKGDIIEFLNEAAGIKGKIGRYDTMIEQINIRKSELHQRLIVLQSEAASSKSMLGEYEKSYEKVMASIKAQQELQKQHEDKNHEVSTKLAETRQKLDAKQQEYHRANSKYSALKNISERYDGYGNSIRKVMEKKQEYPGIIGVVADIIKVDKKYETAIEIALGGSIQNIVTEDESTAKEMISYLKQNRLGRATFLPLTSVKGRSDQIQSGVFKEPGVIDCAANLVKANEKYSGLLGYLLGRIVVVDHINQALALAKKYKYSLRIVTLEGESLNPGGSMSGGAYKNSSNLLGRNREMDDLIKEIDIIKGQIDSLNHSLNSLQDAKNNAKKEGEKATVRLQELSIEENTLRMNLSQVRQADENRTTMLKELNDEESQLKKQITEIDTNKQFFNVSLKELTKRQEDTEQLIDELNKRLEDAALDANEFGETTADIRMKSSGLNQKREFAEENIQRVAKEIQQIKENIQRIEESVENQGTETTEKENQIDSYKETLQHLDQSVKSFNQELVKLEESRQSIGSKHKSFFSRREEISERMSNLDKEHFRLSNQIEKLEDQKTNQSNYMWEEYELTYNSAKELFDEELSKETITTLKKSVNELKNKIRSLGNVNVNAIEEYKNVSERYELLKTQHDDLIAAGEKLNEIIESLDKAMRQQFTEKFKVIQQNFDKVFKELFGGGKGSLELMEDEDILYAGVRIIASPPGKKLQNMMQMSGGEKALTAIALLFAIQGLKPSPFCLLDEIEAALDDANVKRYAQYLNNLTKDTQFIIITHRRGTMNAADVLYGITMQEKGVSTLVSVNLIDNKLDD